jgi:hypothetical protein
VENACKAFNCAPYFALVVDEVNNIKMYIISMAHLLEMFPMGEQVSGWKMSKQWLSKYDADERIIKLEFDYTIKNWWQSA